MTPPLKPEQRHPHHHYRLVHPRSGGVLPAERGDRQTLLHAENAVPEKMMAELAEGARRNEQDFTAAPIDKEWQN